MKVYKGQYLGKNHDLERKNEVDVDKFFMEFAVYEENHGKSRKLFEDINLKILIRAFKDIQKSREKDYPSKRNNSSRNLPFIHSV